MIKSLYELDAVRNYLNRVGAEMRSLRIAIVKRHYKNGYWRDEHKIKFSEDGSIDYSSDEVQPTEKEIDDIKIAFRSCELPTHIKPSRLPKLPAKISKVNIKDIFNFFDRENNLIMMQVRIENNQGDKIYIPYTYWSDKRWRACEPDSELPLWGINQLVNHDIVFIHEGAKSARNALEYSEIDSGHPWSENLRGAAHVGWVGGAMNVKRTDWSSLNNISEAYIIADNDEAGHEAVREISKRLNCVTYLLSFGKTFPPGFDLGDEFPKKLFTDEGFYKGPSFHDCLGMATWMTDKIIQEKGKDIITLRRHAKNLWTYIPDADIFVCERMPKLSYTRQVLDIDLAKFSDSNLTSSLIIKHQPHGNKRTLAYRPDKPSGYIVDSNSSGAGAINIHTPSEIKAVKGNTTPWLDFMEYLIPDEAERHEVYKWCATLISRPEVRMGYALLLVSEKQGIGKTTLGTHVLAPLIGRHNVSFPSEVDICSQFNEWIANKRLAVVNEIYTGQSWKSYNLLKTAITDPQITVNKKFRAQYRVENWCHVFACSNSLRPLKIDQGDRRWYYPKLTETIWPKENFIKLRKWLDGQGLNIIRHWADNFGDYVQGADIAPRTHSKELLIEDSISDEQIEVKRIAHIMNDTQEPIAVTMREVKAWVKNIMRGHAYDSGLELRKAMKSAGAIQLPKRQKISGLMEYILVNQAFIQAYGDKPSEAVKRHKKPIHSIVSEEI